MSAGSELYGNREQNNLAYIFCQHSAMKRINHTEKKQTPQHNRIEAKQLNV